MCILWVGTMLVYRKRKDHSGPFSQLMTFDHISTKTVGLEKAYKKEAPQLRRFAEEMKASYLKREEFSYHHVNRSKGLYGCRLLNKNIWDECETLLFGHFFCEGIWGSNRDGQVPWRSALHAGRPGFCFAGVRATCSFSTGVAETSSCKAGKPRSVPTHQRGLVCNILGSASSVSIWVVPILKVAHELEDLWKYAKLCRASSRSVCLLRQKFRSEVVSRDLFSVSGWFWRLSPLWKVWLWGINERCVWCYVCLCRPRREQLGPDTKTRWKFDSVFLTLATRGQCVVWKFAGRKQLAASTESTSFARLFLVFRLFLLDSHGRLFFLMKKRVAIRPM